MKLLSSIKNSFSITDARFICAVKEMGDPKKVAAALGMSPSSINVYLPRIEKKLDKKLFLRKQSPNLIELTEDGLEIYPFCRQMVDSSDILQESLESSDIHFQGEIKLTGTQTLLEYFCIPYLVDFTKKYPGIDLSIRQLDDVSFMSPSVNEFYFTAEIENDANVYAYFPYHTFTQKLWASKKYIEDFGKVQSIDDLYRHNLLFQRGALQPEKVMELTGVQAAISYNFQRMRTRTFNIIGSRIIDRLCEEGLGIMSGSLETIKLSGLQVECVLPNFSGGEATIYIKVSQRMLSKKIGKVFLDWIFSCRDFTFSKGGLEAPIFPYKPFFEPA